MNLSIKKRHCAFCLNAIEDQKIKLCGKCRRRTYCSRECQIADWSTDGKGQAHRNWCKLVCGEEDIDWKVTTVPGKGLGLVATRALPAMYRIIVDGCHSRNDHQGIKDLMPIGGSFPEKFELNSIACGENGDANGTLCLRISRANHDCNGNADHWYDRTFDVVILFANRDIAEGEEITFNYQLFNDVSCNVSAEFSRNVLRFKWGIICPSNCICYDKEIEKLVIRSREIDTKIISLALQGHSQQALDYVTELMSNHKIMKSSLLNKSRTLYDGFQVAVMKKKTLKAAKPFVEQLYAIQSAIMSPDSAEVKKTEGLMNDISTHHNYLTLG